MALRQYNTNARAEEEQLVNDLAKRNRNYTKVINETRIFTVCFIV